MKLSDLTKGLTILERRNWRPSLEIQRVCSDSRRIKAGDLFVACTGPAADGHQFFEEAYRQGSRVWAGEKSPLSNLPEDVTFLKVADAREALTLLLNQYYGFPSRQLDLIGITGTNGKSTTAYLLSHLLGLRAPAAYIGTLGFKAPHRQELLSNTTPGADEVFSLLHEMVEKRGRFVTLEVSSHSLHQKRVEGLEFKLALFTQLTPEHLDYHQNLENYFQAKRLLFSRIPKPSQMLINQDSPYGRRLLGENPQAKSFSLSERADYQVREIQTHFEGGQFLFEGPRGKARFRTRLPFIHNVANATSVLAALDLLGYDPASFQEALSIFPGVPGRLERIEGNGFSVFIDYAHTPDAFENILSEAKRLRPKRILTLFGCGGNRDPFKRPQMTRIAYHYSDFVILTSDNPRTEDPAQILYEMRQGLPAGALPPNVLEVMDRREGIVELLSLAEPGDVVFILGKGHEDYQILGTGKVHFDDREIVRELLQRRGRVAI